MYTRIGDRLIKNEELIGTFTKGEMIEFLLYELNDVYADFKELDGVADELEDALSDVDDLEARVAELEEELEEFQK